MAACLCRSRVCRRAPAQLVALRAALPVTLSHSCGWFAASALLRSSDESTRGCESSPWQRCDACRHTQLRLSLLRAIASVLLPLENPVEASPVTCLKRRQRSA